MRTAAQRRVYSWIPPSTWLQVCRSRARYVVFTAKTLSLSALSLFWPARTRIDSSWRLTGTPAPWIPCVTPSSLALHDDRYRLARLNSRDIAEGHRVQHGRAIEDQLHALWRGGARESAGMGVPRPPLADEGRARPNARTSTGASAPISSRSHSSLILALTNSTVSPTANCGHMSGGRGGMVR